MRRLRLSGRAALGLNFLLLSCLVATISQASDTIVWRQLGPGGGGNMLAVGVSPHDPNVVLMGSDVGGIFWSVDGGATWSLRNTAGNKPGHLAGYGIYGHFAFDPVDPYLVYFGAWRSADRGYTWDVLINNNGFWGGSGLVDPNTPDTVYTWGYGNVFRSTDGWRSTDCDGYPGPGGTCAPGGVTCMLGTKCYQASCLPNAGETVSAPGCMDYTTGHIRSVVIDPLDSAHLLACATEGLYESWDSATTWSRLPTQGLPSTCNGGSTPGATCQTDANCPGGGTCQKPACESLVLHRDTRKLFMVIQSQPFIIGSPGSGSQWVDVTTWHGGAYRSDNFGSNWTEINGPNAGPDALSTHNPGFEDPYIDPNTQLPDPTRAANWYGGEPGVVSRVCVALNDPPTHPDHPHSGLCSMKIVDTTPPDFNTAHGVQTPSPDDGSVPASTHVAVQGGRLYRLSVWYRSQGVTGYDSYVKIGWYDAQKQPLFWPGLTWNTIEPWAAFAPPWGGTYDWRRFESLVRPPDGARYAWIGVRGSSGTIWIDDVALEEYTGLPRISGNGGAPHFASYSDIVVDPYDGDTIYTGTLRGTFSDANNADAGGVWKTDNGGTTWTLTTRHSWHDNVLDNGSSAPICGDNVCGGRWETWQTCPEDCADGNEPANGHCGDNVCEDGGGGRPANGETQGNCPVDCPFDPDPSPRPYYENVSLWDPVSGLSYGAPRGNGYYNVWVLGIGKDQPVGSPILGNETLFFGQEKVKTNNGGDTWEDVSSNIYSDPQTEPGTLRARGETTDVWTYGVASDTRATNRDWLFYGDEDNLMMASYNGGESFQLEGWQWAGYADNDPTTFSPEIFGGAATSFVLDPVNLNRVYVAVSDLVNFYIPDCCIGGVLQGDFTPGTPTHPGSWSWTRFGDQTNFPKGFGGIELLRAVKPDSTIDFYASIFGKGVYKLANGTGAWTDTYTGSNWKANDGATPLFPINWGVYRIAQAPAAGRLYVAVRGTNQGSLTPDQTGVWASDTNGATWVRISSHVTETPGQCLDNNMDGEPLQDILAVGSGVVLAATYYSYSERSSCAPQPVCPGSSGCVGTWTGDGGIYRGVRNGSGQWSWSRVLRQPNVTGFITSSLDSRILYAFVGQTCCDTAPPGQYAGIYKSLDSGLTWSYVTPDAVKPLMHTGHGRLYAHGRDPRKIYASTIGDGVLEGVVTCTDPVRDFECATRINGTHEPTANPIKGTVVSGSFADTTAGSPDDTYELLRESTGSKKQLLHVWTMPAAVSGVSYSLHVEAFLSASPDDNFNFTIGSRASGNCTGSESNYGPTLISLNGTHTTDPDADQVATVGVLSPGHTVFCLRVADSSSSDTSADSLTVDRAFLLPLPNCADNDGDGYTPSCSSSCYNLHCPEQDCADNDVDVNPAATEGPYGHATCSDLTDNDCDSLTDASDTGCQQGLPDADADADTAIGPGAPITGTYLDTRQANEGSGAVHESMIETNVQGKSRLVKTWRFDAVPGGTHSLHFEGHRLGSGGDNFQFYWSTTFNSGNPTSGFALITNSLISTGNDPAGGLDSDTFGVGASGTIYIQIRDSDPNNSNVADSVLIDELKIKTTP